MPSVYVAKHSPNNLKGFHGADGRVDDAAFDELFAKADEDNMLSLTSAQMTRFTWDHRSPLNLLTAFATAVETVLVWTLVERADHRVRKTDLFDFYDGFYIRFLVNQRELGASMPGFLVYRDPPPPPPP